MGEQTGVGFAPKSGMNAAFGDILNQGRYSVYVSNISEDGILIQGNNLWVPRQGTSGDAIQYENLARDFGVELGGWSFGAQFGDLNNDGTLDLYLTNGYISLDRNRSYWYDFSKVAGGNSTIIGDARNWPAFEGRSLSGYQSKRLWLNDGAGKFVDVAQAVGVNDTYDGRAVAFADLWNRGVLDVVVANQKGPLLVYKNTVTPENEWIEFQLEGHLQQPQRHWGAGHPVLERPAAGAGGFRRQWLRRGEPAAAAFWAGKISADRKSGHPLALGQAADHRQARRRPVAQDQGARMSQTAHLTPPPAAPAGWKHFVSLDNRYIAPIFITCILLVGHLSFGILESYQRTLLAIVVSIGTELLLGRIFFHKWVHPASAYISGISVGILLRSPAFWPYALCAAISIMSKYVLRIKGRHIWNPSNFGISAMLFLVPETVASLSIQWGNYLLPMLVIWVLGSVIIWRLRRFHITFTYVAAFIAFAFLRSWIMGSPWQSEIAPITGPMYQLFIFFMITDPKTTVRAKDGTVCGGVPGRAGRNDYADVPDRLCAVLCSVHRRTDRDAHRDLAGFTAGECTEAGSRALNFASCGDSRPRLSSRAPQLLVGTNSGALLRRIAEGGCPHVICGR